MKKVLSFVLVLAMILGSVSMAFAGAADSLTFVKETAKPFADAPNSYLATVLRDLNVLQGDDNGKVFLEDTISRKEVCAILMRVLGYEDYCTADFAVNAASSFTDVEPGQWYNGYVNLAAQLGYVDGIGGGKFNPSGEVSLNEGVAFVMKALGYAAEHLPLDWPYNFLVPAEAAGLLKGIDKTATTLTREQMFTILYNAMDLPIVAWDASLANILINNDDKMGKYLPVVPAKSFSSLAAGTKTKASYSSKAAIVTEDMVKEAAAAKLDLSEYFGKYVKIATLTHGGTSYLGLGVVDTLSTKLTGVVEKDAANRYATIAGVTVASPDAVASLMVDGGFIFENGEASDDAHIVKKVTPIEAEVVLNKDGEIASVASIQYWKETEELIVDATHAALFQTGKVASQVAFDYKNAVDGGFSVSGTGVKAEIVELTVLGAVSSLAEIQEDDVLTIYSSNNAIRKIEVCRDVVEGTISKIVGEKYTVAGKTLAPSTIGVAKNEYDIKNVASKYAFGLNAAGGYAYIVNLDGPAPAAKAVYSFAIVSTSHAVEETTLVGKALVKVTNASLALVPFGTSTAVKYEYVSYKAVGITEDAFDEDTGKPQLETGDIIAYYLDKDGELAFVDAVLTGSAIVSDVYSKAGLDLKSFGYSTFGATTIKHGSETVALADDVVITRITGKSISLVKLADVKGYTFDSAYVTYNKAGKIDQVFLFGDSDKPEAEVEDNVMTLAAVKEAGYEVGVGYYATILIDGKTETYKVSGSSVVPSTITKASLYAFGVENGVITSKAVKDVTGDITTTTGVSYADGVITWVDDLKVAHYYYTVATPVVYAFGTTTYDVVALADIADAFAAGSLVALYDYDSDGLNDLIVIR